METGQKLLQVLQQDLQQDFVQVVQLEQSSTKGKITSYRQGRQPARKEAATSMRTDFDELAQL